MNPFHNEVTIADGYYVFSNNITGRNKIFSNLITEQFMMLKSSPCWSYIGYFEDIEDAYETVSVVNVYDELKAQKSNFVTNNSSYLSKELLNARKKALEFKDISNLPLQEILKEEKQKKIFELTTPTESDLVRNSLEKKLKDLGEKHSVPIDFIDNLDDIPVFKFDIENSLEENIHNFLKDLSKITLDSESQNLKNLPDQIQQLENNSSIETIILNTTLEMIPEQLKILFDLLCETHKVKIEYLNKQITLDYSNVYNLDTFLLSLEKLLSQLERFEGNN